MACAKCHLPNTRLVIFRIQDPACASCHKDIHGGQFRRTPYDNRCETCHTDKGFKPSTFTMAQHSETRFPLTAAHAAVVCTDCHKPFFDRENLLPAKYTFEDQSCSECHIDPHKGQFTARLAVLLPDGSPAGCRSCHNTKSWRELQGFDHAATDFHSRDRIGPWLASSVIKSENLATGPKKQVSFASAPKQCAGCHEDIHGGQFSTNSTSTECSRCHKVLKWRPSTFDHNTQSTYKLDGAHRDVRCALCHIAPRGSAGRTVLYKPTPRACARLHGSETARN